MRADAQRNRELLLTTARDVFVERGPGAPLEEIARRVGVGIATLYRHFPDRHTLMQAVVKQALTSTIAAAEQAQAEHTDPLDALTAYMHAVLDLRTSAVIPTLLDELDLDEPELAAIRDRGANLLEGLLDAAHRAGALRKGVTFADIGVTLVRLSRPLPGSLPAATQLALAHRHADIFLAGLRATPDAEPLAGPEFDRADLQAGRTRTGPRSTRR